MALLLIGQPSINPKVRMAFENDFCRAFQCNAGKAIGSGCGVDGERLAAGGDDLEAGGLLDSVLVKKATRRGDGSRAAGKGFRFNAAFVSAQMDRLVFFFGEIGIGAGGLEDGVVADFPAELADFQKVEVFDEEDGMGDADLEELDGAAGLRRRLEVAHLGESLDVGKLDAGASIGDAGFIGPGVGIEAHCLPGGPEKVGENRDAACAIPTHFTNGAIGVDVLHGEIGARAAVPQEEKPIGADTVVAVAKGEGESGKNIGREGVPAAPVKRDEIISGAVQFVEVKFHCVPCVFSSGSSSPLSFQEGNH